MAIRTDEELDTTQQQLEKMDATLQEYKYEYGRKKLTTFMKAHIEMMEFQIEDLHQQIDAYVGRRMKRAKKDQ